MTTNNYKSNNYNSTNNSNNNNSNSNKPHFNFENIVIKGNIGSDVFLKTKARERIEFSLAVNKFNKSTKAKTTKWFKIVVFNDALISTIKNNADYKKGANVEIHGEILAEIYNNKPILKIIARKIALNISGN